MRDVARQDDGFNFAGFMADVARHFFGDPVRRFSSKTEWRYRSHGSLKVDVERGTWKDFESGEGGGVLDLIERETGRAGADAVDWLKHQGYRIEDAPPRPIKPAKDDAERTRQALDLWQQTRAPAGTPVELHLKRRGLVLPPCDDIRFAPEHPFGRNADGQWLYVPAMLCVVRNIISNKPVAIHRTALDLAGNQRRDLGNNGRLTLGPTKGGAVKLTPDAEVTTAIGIAEGIETALSLQRLPEWLGAPVWSLLNAGGIANFPVLPAIETLVISIDHDRAGEKAARVVTERWRDAGREIFLAKTDEADSDLNDIIRGTV